MTDKPTQAHRSYAVPPPSPRLFVRTSGYTLVIPLADQADLLPTLRERICYHLNLCASVGCGCVVDGADVTCFESDAGQQRKLYHSEGPTWSVLIKSLDTYVSIDIHTTDQMAVVEMRSLYRELRTLGYPIFVHGVTHI